MTRKLYVGITDICSCCVRDWASYKSPRPKAIYDVALIYVLYTTWWLTNCIDVQNCICPTRYDILVTMWESNIWYICSPQSLSLPNPLFSVNFIVLVLCKSVWSRNLVRNHCTADLLFPWFVPIQWNLHSVLIGSSESKSQILAKPRRNKYVFFHSYTRLLTRPLIRQYRLK